MRIAPAGKGRRVPLAHGKLPEGMKARSLIAISLVLGVTGASSAARAEAPSQAQTIAVLGIDSDDVQDQADALADALKDRAREAPGWVLMEKSPSLGSLTVSLKCSAKPDATCQQRIADSLKSDRYVWGVMTKAGGGGQVNVELHLFRRGKADFMIRETYSDTYKVKSEPKLQGLARRLFEELTGTSAGHVTVVAGKGGGEVIVDNGRHVPLKNGRATLDLATGTHTLDVLVPGSTRKSKQIDVQNGAELQVDIDVDAAAVEPPGSERSSPFPTRTVVGGGMVVIGAGLAVTSVIFGAKWIGLQGDSTSDDIMKKLNDPSYSTSTWAREVRPQVKDGASLDVACSATDAQNFVREECEKHSDSKVSSGLAIGFGAGALLVGGIGVYLLATKPASSEAGPPPPRTSSGPKDIKLLPLLGGTNGLSLTGTF